MRCEVSCGRVAMGASASAGTAKMPSYSPITGPLCFAFLFTLMPNAGTLDVLARILWFICRAVSTGTDKNVGTNYYIFLCTNEYGYGRYIHLYTSVL